MHHLVYNFNPRHCIYLQIQKIVIGKSGIQSCDEIKQRLSADGVAQRAFLVARDAATVTGREPLRGRERLQIVGADPLGVETLVQGLVAPRHLTRVALDAAKNLAVPRLYAKRVVDGLERCAF